MKPEKQGITIGEVFSTINARQLDQVRYILGSIIDEPHKANPDAFSYDLSFLSDWAQMLVVRELIARTLLTISSDKKED